MYSDFPQNILCNVFSIARLVSWKESQEVITSLVFSKVISPTCHDFYGTEIFEEFRPAVLQNVSDFDLCDYLLMIRFQVKTFFGKKTAVGGVKCFSWHWEVHGISLSDW